MRTADSPESKSARARKLKIRAAIVFVVALAFGTMVLIAENDSETPATSAGSQNGNSTGAELPMVRRDSDDPMAVGSVDAPVVLSQWTDFRCPFCAVFNRETLPPIISEYVETGKVRFEVNDVSFYGEQSMNAAVAARAAGRQDRYFEFMEAVYAEAPEKGHPDIGRSDLIDFARKAGIPNLRRFREDLDDPRLMSEVQESHLGAQHLGVNSVPFFVVGDTALAGAQPIETFRQFLDEAIGKAG